MTFLSLGPALSLNRGERGEGRAFFCENLPGRSCYHQVKSADGNDLTISVTFNLKFTFDYHFDHL